MPVILARGRLRQENCHNFKVYLAHIGLGQPHCRPCLKKTKAERGGRKWFQLASEMNMYLVRKGKKKDGEKSRWHLGAKALLWEIQGLTRQRPLV